MEIKLLSVSVEEEVYNVYILIFISGKESIIEF